MPAKPKTTETKKKVKGNSAAKIYETLRDEILSLKLEPSALVDEVSLANRFGVSRSPVREAMVRLVSESLLQTLPNKGTIVAPLRIEEFPQYIDALDIIQRTVTRLAAKFRNADDLKKIHIKQDKFAKCVKQGDVLGMILSNREFHIAIAKAGHNRYLEQIYCRLLDDGQRSLRLYFKSYGDILPIDMSNAHEQLINAIEKQDVNLAEHLASEHTMEMQQRFLDYLGLRHTNTIAIEPNFPLHK